MLKLRTQSSLPRRTRTEARRQKKLTYLHPLAKERSWSQLLDVQTKRATKVDHPRIWTIRWHYPTVRETKLGTPPVPYPGAKGRLQTQEERILLWLEENELQSESDDDNDLSDSESENQEDETPEEPDQGSLNSTISTKEAESQDGVAEESSNSDDEEDNPEAVKMQLIINEFLRDFVPN